MNCCINCFVDSSLKKIIKSNSQFIGDCDFCSSTSTDVINCEQLSSFFESLFDLYTPHSSVIASLKIDSSLLMYEHINTYWPYLFNHEMLDSKMIKFLINSIAKGIDDYDEIIFSNPVELKRILSEGLDTENLELQWDSFANEIKYNNRFFLNEKLDTDLLQSVFERLGKTYTVNEEFFRARISDELLPIDKLGKPEAHLATGGRANPVGIPYLYLSNDLKTTLYETRISLHETISVGKFIAIENINLISLTNVSKFGPFEIQDKGFSVEEFIGYRPYLQKLELELSKPVRKQDVHLDYLPTQFLCEFLKSLGFDAVEYKSAMNPDGSNLALFTDTKVKCVESKLYRINSLKYTWDEL